MAVTLPTSFAARDPDIHRPGQVIDTRDEKDVIENAHFLLGKDRRHHFCKEFIDDDVGGGSPDYRIVHTSTTSTEVLRFGVEAGHAKSTGGAGVRLKFLFCAEQEAATGNGTIYIVRYDTAGVAAETMTQSVTQGGGVLYFTATGLRMAADTEWEIRIELDSGEANKYLRLLRFACYEMDLANTDLP